MNGPVVIVMGVAGSGKSTVGALLAERLAVPFVEGDDFHDSGVITQMGLGSPLTSTQRREWLDRVHRELVRLAPGGVVAACSALTRSARHQLTDGLDGARLVWLHGSSGLLHSRLTRRVGHPVGTSLLPSQLHTLEPPTDALRVQIRHSPDEIVAEILARLGHPPPL